MLKWIVILLIGVGIYYLSQNWSTLTSQWTAGVSKLLTTPSAGNESPENGAARVLNILSGARSTAESWGVRNVGGLQMETPFQLASVAAPAGNRPAAGILIENYEARAGSQTLFVVHASNSNVVGGLRLGWSDAPLSHAAEHLQMDVISLNSTATLLNGCRAQRSDYVSRGSPRVRVRCLLLERGHHAWFIEYHAPEADTRAEQIYQRMIYSARPF